MTTFPVTLPSGAEVQIGGIPLGSDEKMKRLFPDLWENILSKDITKINNNAELERICFHIVKHFNPGVKEETFCVDHYSALEIIAIFLGNASDESKKKAALR
jgi:hypothetical protein